MSRLPTKIGHVHLKVADLERSVAFYSEVLGLDVSERVGGTYAFLTFGDEHHDLALQVRPGAEPAPARALGLYHAAFEVDERAALAEVASRLERLGVPFSPVDHGISKALYFSDPDGNGVEVYLDTRHERTAWGGVSDVFDPHAAIASGAAVPPELRLLRYFVAVAEELNFTRAAAGLYMAQPSLSAAIRQLERQLASPLFLRDTRHVELTAAGRALLPHAREALAAAQRGVLAVRAAQGGAMEVLRFLYTMPLEPVALDALDRLEARDPAPMVTARGVWAGELVRELREGHADAGLLRFPDDPSRLESIALRGDPVCALVAEDHPIAGGPPVHLADLADQPVLTWANELGLDQYNAFVAGAYRAAGLAPDAFTTRRLDVPGWLPVVQGRAVALIGASERSPGGTAKVAISDAPRMPLLVAWPAGARPAPVDALAAAVQAGVDALTAVTIAVSSGTQP